MKLKLITLLLLTTFSSLFSAGQTAVDHLSIDTTITGFHFAADFQGTIIFTKHGPSDIQTINPTAFSVTIAPNMTFESGKEQLDQLLNMSKQNDYKILSLLKKDTTIKGNSAYYISYIETDDKTKYKNIVFNAFVMKGSTLLLFTSGDLDNGIYADRFKKTFYGISL